MKYCFRIIILVIITAHLSCERSDVDPIDIFATEELTNGVDLDLGTDEGLDKLMVNADRIIETPEGFHIKGTIFSESLSGTIPVTSGGFTIEKGLATGGLRKGLSGLKFNGYGTSSFPSGGIFSSADISEVPGSEVWYNTGKIFKAESETSNLPLLDNRYYFRYRMEKGKEREYRMKKIIVRLREYYLDARDPAALFTGDVFSEKAGTRKLIVEKGVVGISANELFEFVPYQYGGNLETVSGGTGFRQMNGGIAISGIIPIKKYPVKILGQAVINTSFSSSGSSDFFERGFEDASFSIGVNGKLLFSQDLIRFLTGVDTVTLGRATLQAEFSDNDFSIRMAGEYSDNILERFLGETMMKFIPYHSREGIMYMRGSENPDDFIIYLEENVSLQIPGLGTAPLANSIFRVTKDGISLTGSLALPYNIGNVTVTGLINSDGSFLLKGVTDCNVDLGGGLTWNADLDVEVSEKGVSFNGSMELPYGIGETEVAGGLLTDELWFRGTINSSIPFPVNASIYSNLEVSISTKTGVSLSGNLSLPGGIGAVSVAGAIDNTELKLTGTVSAGVNISFGSSGVNTGTALSLTASSRTGVVMTGSVSLPMSMGSASATISVTGGGLSMTGDLGSHIRISGYPLFDADMSVSASTGGVMWLSGTMKFSC